MVLGRAGRRRHTCQVVNLPSWTSVDPLGEALHLLRMSGVFYSRSEASAPWGVQIPAMPDFLLFHAITGGRCWLETDGDPPRPLSRGDFALLSHGEGHKLVSEPGQRALPLFDIPRDEVGDRYDVIRYGGDGAHTSLVCGAVRFDHPAARHLVSLLPRSIILEEAAADRHEWLPATLRLMAAEARELRPGGEAVITRLADILVVQAIRSWMDHDPAAQTGWLGALKDRQLGRALAMIHRDPAYPWTVASLARQATMSRSAFAARFTDIVGEPPLQYLTRWRMNLASTLLLEPNLGLADLAGRVGYQSEAAFSRAFKRHAGVSPGAARQRARSA
jgi:AraC-like DNA-binding protein